MKSRNLIIQGSWNLTEFEILGFELLKSHNPIICQSPWFWFQVLRLRVKFNKYKDLIFYRVLWNITKFAQYSWTTQFSLLLKLRCLVEIILPCCLKRKGNHVERWVIYSSIIKEKLENHRRDTPKRLKKKTQKLEEAWEEVQKIQ